MAKLSKLYIVKGYNQIFSTHKISAVANHIGLHRNSVSRLLKQDESSVIRHNGYEIYVTSKNENGWVLNL